MVQLTDEQQRAIEKFRTGRPLKIAAFAGSGRTSTLILLAKTKRSGSLYLAFNKSISEEATERFPRTVDCRTTHSIAFRAVMPGFQSGPKLTNSAHPKQLSEIAGYHTIVFGDVIKLTGVQPAPSPPRTVPSTPPAKPVSFWKRFFGG